LIGISLLILLSAVLETKLMRPGFPIPTLALLLPITLFFPYRILIPLAFIAGLFKDALYLNTIWLSPLLFTILAFSGLIYRNYVNIKLFLPKILYFTLFAIIYTWLLGVVHQSNSGFFELSKTVVFTILISLVVERWVS
jgi:hypothetical protein